MREHYPVEFAVFQALSKWPDPAVKEGMWAVQPTRLIALAATWQLSSQSKPACCPNRSRRQHAEGKTHPLPQRHPAGDRQFRAIRRWCR